MLRLILIPILMLLMMVWMIVLIASLIHGLKLGQVPEEGIQNWSSLSEIDECLRSW